MIVEDGSGLSTADSYVSLIEADLYMSTFRSCDGWDGTDSDKESMLIIATRAIDLLYGTQYRSIKKLSGALLFPRADFYDIHNTLVTQGTIPKNLKDAVCEIALVRYNGGNILPTSTTSNNTSDKIKIGPIEISSTSGGYSGINDEQYSGFYEVEQLLKSILKKSKGTGIGMGPSSGTVYNMRR